MSLVIAMHDHTKGIMVSDGRACLIGDSQLIPYAEDRIKTIYLPNHSILGATGDSEITEQLRDAVKAISSIHTFPQLYRFRLPELINNFRARYPDGVFGAVLLGAAAGAVYCGHYTDKYEPSFLGASYGVGFTVLGCSGTAHIEAVKKVDEFVDREMRDSLDLARATEGLRGIITDLATRHVEINDRCDFKYIDTQGRIVLAGADCTSRNTSKDTSAVNGRASSDISSTVIPGGGIDFASNLHLNKTLDSITDGSTRFAAAESDADNTAAHVLTAAITVPPSWTSTESETMQPVTGFGWSVTSASLTDTYNVKAVVSVQSSATSYNVALYVDGDTSTDYSIVYPAARGSDGVILFASISGLSPGTHTIQLYAAPTTPSATVPVYGWGVCQRIF